MKNVFKEIGFACLLLVLALLLVFSLFWALSIGTVKLPVREIYETVLASRSLPAESPSRRQDRGLSMISSGCFVCRA